MVKVYGPLFSHRASGSLAGLITYSRCRSRSVVRKKPIPTYTGSDLKTAYRAMYAALAPRWTSFTAAQKAKWDALAATGAITPYNAYLGFNLHRWRHWLSPVIDPADLSADGLLPEMGAGTATPGAHCLHISVNYWKANDAWLVSLSRKLVAAGNPTFITTRHVWAPLVKSYLLWLDTPLLPGTYWYFGQVYTKDGHMAVGVSAFSGTVT